MNLNRVGHFLLPLVGIGIAGLAWWLTSMEITDLPSPLETWDESKLYLLEPWAKRGEMDQGIGRLAYYSLIRVARGFLLGSRHWRPARVSARHVEGRPSHVRSRDSGFAADLAAGVAAARARAVSEVGAGSSVRHRRLLDVAHGLEHDGRACARSRRITGMWPRCSVCPGPTTFTKIVLPATLPYMFTGFRLSLGIAWLVIVASEMLTGTPGIGGFLWQEYNSLIYSHILLAILTIGVVGFLLDRMMGLAEARLRSI